MSPRAEALYQILGLMFGEKEATGVAIMDGGELTWTRYLGKELRRQ